MKKYILLITISFALIATIILAGIFFTPTTTIKNSDQNLTNDQVSNNTLQISTVNSTTTPEFFTFGDEFGQAILVELATAQQENQPENYTLVVAPVGFEMQPDNNNHAICSEVGTSVVAPPPGTMTSLDQNANMSPYLDRIIRFFDLPASNQYIITMWHPTTQSNDYTLVSAKAAGDTGVCPYLLDEDV